MLDIRFIARFRPNARPVADDGVKVADTGFVARVPQNPPQSYVEQDLLDEAAKPGNSDAYAVIDLRFVGYVLGTYILHIDSVAETATVPPSYEWNPGSHGATVIINVVPVLPFAAGLLSVGTFASMLFVWARRQRKQ